MPRRFMTPEDLRKSVTNKDLAMAMEDIDRLSSDTLEFLKNAGCEHQFMGTILCVAAAKYAARISDNAREAKTAVKYMEQIWTHACKIVFANTFDSLGKRKI